MPPTPDAAVPIDATHGWLWFAVSVVPDIFLIAAVIGLWVQLARIRREARVAVTLAAEERHRLHAQMTSIIDPFVLGEPVSDASGRVVDFIYADVNPAACAFIGLDREHLLGRRLLELFPQLKTTGLQSKFADTAETGRPTNVDDFPFPMADGRTHWMDIRAVRADGGVNFIWRDNTERQEALQKIATSEEQFRLLAENSTDVVVRIDAHDKIVWVSPSVTSVLGWKVADVVGRNAFDFLATEETRRQFRRDKARVFAGEGAVSRSEVRSASGKVHWMEAHASPFRQPDGRIDGLIAAMRIIDTEVEVERALERRARTDDLTGLLNRKEFLDRVAGLVARGDRDFAVLWCDIDRFKVVNDTHGHAAGDAVLQALGERIRGCLPQPDDLAARVGGDEIIVLLHGVHGLEEAERAAERLRSAAAEPIPFDGAAIGVTLSIGTTLPLPDEGIDAILARADDAMYRAKEEGRNKVIAA